MRRIQELNLIMDELIANPEEYSVEYFDEILFEVETYLKKELKNTYGDNVLLFS